MAKKVAEKEPESTTAVALAPRLKRIELSGQQMLAQVRAMVVTTAEEFEQTGLIRKTIKAKLEELEEFIEPIRKAQYEAYQTTLGQKKLVSGPLESADAILVRLRGEWTQHLERERQKEQERLLEVEREKERERQLEEATRLAEAGHADAAAELLEEEVYVSPTVIKVEKPASDPDFQQRKLWSAEVVDFRALVNAVAKGDAPIECLKADMPFLNKQAQAFRGGLNIVGVKAVSRVSEAVRG